MHVILKANNFSLANFQSMIKYIVAAKKKPKWIKLIKIPKKVCISFIEEDIQMFSKLKRRLVKDLQIQDDNIRFSEGKLSFHGISKILLNKISTDSLNGFNEIDIEGLRKYIPLNNLLLLTQYTNYVTMNNEIEEEYFDDFIRPTINTEYDILAIDCEMVETENGSEVGRIVLVNSKGNTVYDKIIIPKGSIVDYRTEYSGLKEEHFSSEKAIGYNTFIKELLGLVGFNTILVGHGIENDLNAIKFYTNNIVDTAILFLNSKGHKISLKTLVYKYFNTSIQKADHNPVIDACYSLKLLNYKIEYIKNAISQTKETIIEDVNVKYCETPSELLSDDLKAIGIFYDCYENLSKYFDKPFFHIIFLRGPSENEISIFFK